MIILDKYNRLRPYLHIGGWLLYAGVVLVPAFMRMPGIWKFDIPVYLLVLVSSFYYNNAILIPKYFKKHLYRRYFLKTCYVLIAGLACLIAMLFLLHTIDTDKIYYLPVMCLKVGVTYIIESSILILIKVAKEWYIESQKLRDIAFQKVRFELQLLKKQLDPHFIFNTLNNIYSLVLTKSDNAPDAILRLSELFDYVLHESAADSVALTKELAFIESYISLQKLRLKEHQVIQYEVKGDVHGYVAPLIIINFIENAFKHAQGNVLTEDGSYYISIAIRITGDVLYFTIKNGIYPAKGNEAITEGIGIANAMKRLAMIYNEDYNLEIGPGEHLYTVTLKIPIYDQVPYSG